MPGQSPPSPCQSCTLGAPSSLHSGAAVQELLSWDAKAGKPLLPRDPFFLDTCLCLRLSKPLLLPWVFFYFTASPWVCISYEPASEHSTRWVCGQPGTPSARLPLWKSNNFVQTDSSVCWGMGFCYTGNKGFTLGWFSEYCMA